MRIIDPTFEYILAPTRADAYRVIATAMRNCYRAELNAMPATDEEMVAKAVKLKHLSLLEFVDVAVNITCDRGVTHELVRHRLASYCLSGETEVVAFRKEGSSASSQKKWTIKQLFDWTSDPKRKGRIGLIRLRSVDKSGRIIPGKIGNIVFSGKQETFTVKFKSGREIRSTKQHRFMTKDGWMQLKDLNIGDRVYANGIEALENKEWLERVYIEENNTLKEVAALAQTCVTDEVTSIEKYGIEDTYDISMESSPHNFVANGIVVHNSQESTRYCSYDGEKFGREITVIRPSWAAKTSSEEPVDESEKYQDWLAHMYSSEKAYMAMLDHGASPQEARSVLPNSLAAKIAIKANLREWIHIFRMRCDAPAHPDMRQTMTPILVSMLDLYPVVFQPVYSGLSQKGALK